MLTNLYQLAARHLISTRSIILAFISTGLYIYLNRQRKSPHTLPFTLLKGLFNLPLIPELLLGYPKSRPTAREVMDQISKEMGLYDYGENAQNLQGNVDALLIDLFEGAKKGSLTRFACWSQLNNVIKVVLRKRLLTVDYLKKHPQAEKLEIPEPIFIIGSWRSGTTALHAYFDLDPACRAFHTWEIRRGILSPQTVSTINKAHIGVLGKDPRCIQEQEEINFLNLLFPEFKSMHNMKVNEPDECDPAYLDLNRGVYRYIVSHLFPTFRERQEIAEEPESTYRWYKRALQAFEHQRLTLENGGVEPTSLPYTYTVFKFPVHSMNMATILHVFPGAKFVWPHRDLRKVVPSFGKLSLLVHQMFSNQDRTLFEEGKQKFEFLADQVPNWIKERERLFGAGAEYEGRMADLHYVEFVKNPVEAMKRLYADLGLEFTPALAQAIMERKKVDTEVRKSGKAKPHSYSAEEFGLTEEMMVDAFAEYERAYNVVRESKRVI
ncbi:hypothetical protein HDV05_005913 [Chytridiales sp. JEL 0842]|nr:hypothetical protein HDV05_005913 [Chytridiales sp. JEL 0842]